MVFTAPFTNDDLWHKRRSPHSLQSESPAPVIHFDLSSMVLPTNSSQTATPQQLNPFQLQYSAFPAFQPTMSSSEFSTNHNPPNHLNTLTENAQVPSGFVSNFDPAPVSDAALCEASNAGMQEDCEIAELIKDFNSADLAVIDQLLYADNGLDI